MTLTGQASSFTPGAAVRAVHAHTVGRVQVRPKNIAGTGTPMLWWTLTARTWTDWLPVHDFVVEHDLATQLAEIGHPVSSLAFAALSHLRQNPARPRAPGFDELPDPLTGCSATPPRRRRDLRPDPAPGFTVRDPDTHHPSTSAKLAPGPRKQGQPRAVAQLGSALDWGSRGRRFKSCQPDKWK